jgi:hypothetical protein
VFDFRMGRGREDPKHFLGNFDGLLQSDGDAVYDSVGGPKMVHACCWSHSRRKFVENEGDRNSDHNLPQIQEQNLPIEFQFEPSGRSLFLSLLYVAGILLLGAMLSLLLRVSVPNIKRRSQLKDQLSEAGKIISTVSSEVDDNLRVLLRVERRALD